MTNRLTMTSTCRGCRVLPCPPLLLRCFGVVSPYTIVDGVLIARLVGENALAAANVAYPAISFTLAMGIMLGTGGSRGGPQDGGWISGGGPRDLAFWPWWRCASAWRPAWRGPCSSGRWPGRWGPAICRWTIRSPICGCACFAPMAMLQLLFESFFVTGPGGPAWAWAGDCGGRHQRRAGLSLYGAYADGHTAPPWALLRVI